MSYETDIIAWANKQAWLIRHQQFDLLDIEHLAEEVEDVGRREQRDLARRIAVLMAHCSSGSFSQSGVGLAGSGRFGNSVKPWIFT